MPWEDMIDIYSKLRKYVDWWENDDDDGDKHKIIIRYVKNHNFVTLFDLCVGISLKNKDKVCSIKYLTNFQAILSSETLCTNN